MEVCPGVWKLMLCNGSLAYACTSNRQPLLSTLSVWCDMGSNIIAYQLDSVVE